MSGIHAYSLCLKLDHPAQIRHAKCPTIYISKFFKPKCNPARKQQNFLTEQGKLYMTR